MTQKTLAFHTVADTDKPKDEFGSYPQRPRTFAEVVRAIYDVVEDGLYEKFFNEDGTVDHVLILEEQHERLILSDECVRNGNWQDKVLDYLVKNQSYILGRLIISNYVTVS